MASSTLIDSGNFSELIELVARSEADVMRLPRETYLKILKHLTTRAPLERLEEVARDDSLYITVERRDLLQLLTNRDYTQAENPTPSAELSQGANGGRGASLTKRQIGSPPTTKAQKKELVETWDKIPVEDRPPLPDWLAEECGTDPATELPNVIESTFHGWRRYLK